MLYQVLLFLSFSIVYVCGRKVVVTGAAGRTGSLILKKLGALNIPATGLTRTEKSAKKLTKLIKKELGENNSITIEVCDVTSPESLSKSMNDASEVILATSAVPKIKPLSIIKLLFMKLLRKEGGRPEFRFLPNGDPYNVDYLGASYQIKAACTAGVKHFVFLSSMGGTQPENFLNSIGKVDGDDKSGDILLWKRKAEKELIDSGLPYTIIHPGGLLDQKEGIREIVSGVDDELLKREVRSIPRGDVASCCIQALMNDGAMNKSIDIISEAPQENEVVTDWKSFFNKAGNCKYE